MINPCKGICTLKNDQCIGCKRTKDEIINWWDYDDNEQERIYNELENRRLNKSININNKFISRQKNNENMIKKFNEFRINEEINWNKKPWIWLKNIMKLEEPDYDDSEYDLNDIVDMEFEFTANILNYSNSEEILYAVKKLSDTYNLETRITHYSNTFLVKSRGEKKDCDNFYETIKSVLYYD